MQLTIQNGQLASIINFANALKIRGAKTNRSRYRFTQILTTRFNEVESERIAMSKEYAILDGNGNVKSNAQGTIIFKNVDAKNDYRNGNKELQESESLITIDDFQAQIQYFYDFLLAYDGELSDTDGYLFGLILDMLEDAGFQEKGDSK